MSPDTCSADGRAYNVKGAHSTGPPLNIWLFPLRKMFEVQVVAAANTTLEAYYRAAALRR
jgi:hypothetical protein